MKCTKCNDTGIAVKHKSSFDGRYYITSLSGGPCPKCIAGLRKMMEVPIFRSA